MDIESAVGRRKGRVGIKRDRKMGDVVGLPAGDKKK
jgi:hypothetical protein